MSELELKEEVIKAISEVYDPEIPVNVYELGLIYDIKIFPVNNVYVLMTLTSPSQQHVALLTWNFRRLHRWLAHTKVLRPATSLMNTLNTFC